MRYDKFFSPITVTMPSLPTAQSVEIPQQSSEYDFLLMELIRLPYYVVDNTSQTVYEGNHRLLELLHDWDYRYRLNIHIIAKNGSWGIWHNGHKNVTGYGNTISIFQHDYPHQRYTQADIEAWHDNHPNMHIRGDDEKDWLIFSGYDNSVKSYFVASTNPYILFLQKQDDGLFCKVWEIYDGIELTGSIINKQGQIHAFEGHGISDPATIIIQANTGEILSTEPTVHVKHRSY